MEFFIKVLKSIIFPVKSFLGNFYRHLAIYFWSHWLQWPSKQNKKQTKCKFAKVSLYIHIKNEQLAPIGDIYLVGPKIEMSAAAAAASNDDNSVQNCLYYPLIATCSLTHSPILYVSLFFETSVTR